MMKNLIAIVFFITIMMVSSYAKEEPHPLPPLIPQEFYSTINFTLYNTPPTPGVMYYSGTDKAYLYELFEYYGDGYSSNATNLVQENSTWFFMSGECKPWFGVYGSLFDWVVYAKYEGQVEFNGQLCDSWALNYTGGHIMLYNVDRTPVYLYTFIEAVPNDTSSDVFVSWTFLDFQPMKIDPSIFQTPEQCYGHGYICPNGSIEVMDFYFYHPTNDYSIDNNNVADLIGDTGFVCFDGFSSADQLVSSVRVQLNTSWGSYALCNFNVCDTLNLLTVGREASFGVTPGSGQCTNNSVTGSWYSFTTQSNCDNPNAESCAWKEIGILKTVTAQCLIQNGFFQACEADGGIPFVTASEVFNNAFQYDDPSEGGCPDVTDIPEGKTHLKKTTAEVKSFAGPATSTATGHVRSLKGVSAFQHALEQIYRQI